MKETRRYKRFDLLSTLAVLGVLTSLAFEGFFVFELYDRDLESLKRFLPDALRSVPVLSSPEEPAPVG